jgi:hypothetical protein
VVIRVSGQYSWSQTFKGKEAVLLIYKLRDRKIVEMTQYQDSTLCERVLGPYPRLPR